MSNSTKTKIERPDIVTDKHLVYLDNLRDSGVTNMWGASSYLERDTDLNHGDAKVVLAYWMKSFIERHPN